MEIAALQMTPVSMHAESHLGQNQPKEEEVPAEEPAVEDIACPVAKLGLNQPMTDFFRPVMGGGSILSVEKEVHPDLGVQCPFPAY